MSIFASITYAKKEIVIPLFVGTGNMIALHQEGFEQSLAGMLCLNEELG
jgi:hypothetical protein